MKQRNKNLKLQARQRAWDSMDNKDKMATTRPGSEKK